MHASVLDIWLSLRFFNGCTLVQLFLLFLFLLFFAMYLFLLLFILFMHVYLFRLIFFFFFLLKIQAIGDYVKFNLLLKVSRGIKEESFRVELNKKLGGKFYVSRMEQVHP